MKVRFLDLSIKSKSEISKHLDIYKKFLLKGNFVMGKKVYEFEKTISKIVSKKYTVGCSSGTNSLYLALKSLDIKKGEHVLVPCLSWVSTFTSVKKVGAEPIGVDIDDDFQIDFNDLKKRATKKTRALILVYFTGFYKSYDKLKTFCKKRKIKIIEDCAQSFGAIKYGKNNGSYGDISCFSMNPMKIFNGFGDAGALSTNDKKLYQKIINLRYVGTTNKELVTDPELNHKIDSLQCEILLENLKKIKFKINKRITNASYYQNNLTKKIKKPRLEDNGSHIYYAYSILTKRRDKLKEFLNKKNVETQIQHPYVISDHPGLKNRFNKSKNFPNGKKIVKEILSIPVHEKLTIKEIRYVVKNINEFYENAL